MKHFDEICYYCDAFGVDACPLNYKFPIPKFNHGGVILPSETVIFTMSAKNPKIRGKKADLILCDDVYIHRKQTKNQKLKSLKRIMKKYQIKNVGKE